MRLRFAIPLTIAIWLLGAALSWYFRDNVSLVITAVTAMILAADSSRLGMKHFAGLMGQPPLVTGVITLLAWPIALPAYLSLRRRVLLGTARDRVDADGRISPGWAIAIVAVAGFQLWAFFAGRPLQEKANKVHQIATEAVMAPVLVNVSDRRITVSVSSELGTDTLGSRQLAEQAARAIAWHYPGGKSLNGIVVRFIEQDRRGPVTVTREHQRFSWRPAEFAYDPKEEQEWVASVELRFAESSTDTCSAEVAFTSWSNDQEFFGYGSGLVTCHSEPDQPESMIFIRIGNTALDGDEARILVALGATHDSEQDPGARCQEWGACSCLVTFARDGDQRHGLGLCAFGSAEHPSGSIQLRLSPSVAS